MRNSSTVNSICFVGNYVPRQCGIATFTTDLTESVAAESPATSCFTIAMNDTSEGYDYPERVRMSIRDDSTEEYDLAAEFLNVHHTDIVCVQHEYGIYGPNSGERILDLMRQLSMPVVSTLHTVLDEPDEQQKHVMVELCELSDRVVVMSERGRQFLEEIYGVAPERIVHVPHGIPDVSFIDPTYYKGKFDVQGKRLLLTFGLLSPGKGIEHAIRSLPPVVERFPETKYLILGATHPAIVRESGESYRQSLIDLAEDLGVSEHVEFVNKFVSLEELIEYLCASDIFITPYPSIKQITSGTLAYAVGTGNAVVSTPYWYAEELLDDGRGRLVPVSDSDSMGAEIIDLLDNPTARNAMRKRAYQYSRRMTWPTVAKRYMDLFEQTRADRETNPHRIQSAGSLRYAGTMPRIKFDHLRVLTDDTGILQHALFTVPDRREGYCSDDNARALIVAVQANSAFPHEHALFKSLATTYLTFIEHAMNQSTGRFRNFMSYSRQWLDNAGSEDCHGRCLSGVGYLIGESSFPALTDLATRIFDRAMPVAHGFTSPRAWAYTILGIRDYLKRFRGDLAAARMLANLADRLYTRFPRTEQSAWPWPEEQLTYANAVIPRALIAAGAYLGRQELIDRGLDSLSWLLTLQTAENGCLSILGNRRWFRLGGTRAIFDQQPIEAQNLAQASAEAYLVTEDDAWLSHIERCTRWYIGDNDLGVPLYDDETGGCRDGLQPNGANANEGAESTLAWLQSALVAETIGA